MEEIVWDKTARANFDEILAKVPVYLRSIAAKKVSQKAEGLARSDARPEVSQKDMVDAFFIETPFGFHGPLKADMRALGIDYTKYGHEK